MLSRRSFLKTSALLALAPTVPAFLARSAYAAEPDRDSRVLVVIQLDGGNDGINTVVPFADEGYAKHRKSLRLPAGSLLKINDRVGLHPQMSDAGKLLERGELAIVQGVGYPNPNRSHFQSMKIWHTARTDPEEHQGLGWVGQGLDAVEGTRSALLVGPGQPPVALRGRRSVASALERVEDFIIPAGNDPRKILALKEPANDLMAFVHRNMVEACSTADRLADILKAKPAGSPYPGTELGQRLRLIAQLLKAGVGARVMYTLQPGYDTHGDQLPSHAQLLFALSSGLKAFLDDLKKAGLAERVLVLCFSEFGRRVAENDSRGTDHGTAGPVFVAGTKVKAGLIGEPPSLTDLDGGDLKAGLDFRRIYASVLEEWLQVNSKEVLGSEFMRLELFR